MKRYYDRGSRVTEINPGDWVLVKDECRQDICPHFLRPMEGDRKK